MSSVDLRSWLDEDLPKRNIRQLSLKAGVGRRVIYAILRGHVPRAETAKRIEEATEGAVSAAEILGLSDTEAA